MAAEVELKLSIDPTALANVRRHPAIARVARGSASTTRLVSTYFDTPRWELRESGLALRLRRSGRRWLQTAKSEGSQLAGLSTRAEFEWVLGAPRLDPAKLAQTPWRDLFEATIRRIKPRFVTDIVRTSQALAFPQGTRASLCVDSGEIRAGRKRVPIAEIEIEIVEGDPGPVFDLALALAADLPVAIEYASKAERGYALLRPEPPEPIRAKTIDLAPDISAPAAIAAVGADCLLQIGVNARHVALGVDSEFLHQLRVGVRRLRSLTKLALPLMPHAASAAIDDDLKWLGSTLGPARDWDVFAGETLPAIGARLRPPQLRREAGQLKARATRMRGVRYAAARSAAGSPRLTRLLLAFGARFTALTGARSAAPEASEVPAAREFAKAALDKYQRKLIKRGKQLRHATPVERHRARIAAKRLRYAAEFFAPLYPSGRTKAHLAALARLQAALGKLNDLATAERLLEELAQSSKVSLAVARATGIVSGWIAASEAHEVARAAKAWRKFAKAKSFW